MSGLFVAFWPLAVGVAIAAVVVLFTQQNQSLYENRTRRTRARRSSESFSQSKSFAKSQRSTNSTYSNIKHPCGICGEGIKDTEKDLSKLVCDHEFHLDCIKIYSHFNSCRGQGNCPLQSCGKPFSTSAFL